MRNGLVALPSHLPPPPAEGIKATMGGEGAVIKALPVCSESLAGLIPQVDTKRSDQGLLLRAFPSCSHEKHRLKLPYLSMWGDGDKACRADYL